MNIQNLEDKRLLLKYKICSFDIKLNPQCDLIELQNDYLNIKKQITDLKGLIERQNKIIKILIRKIHSNSLNQNNNN